MHGTCLPDKLLEVKKKGSLHSLSISHSFKTEQDQQVSPVSRKNKLSGKTGFYGGIITQTTKYSEGRSPHLAEPAKPALPRAQPKRAVGALQRYPLWPLATMCCIKSIKTLSETKNCHISTVFQDIFGSNFWLLLICVKYFHICLCVSFKLRSTWLL